MLTYELDEEGLHVVQKGLLLPANHFNFLLSLNITLYMHIHSIYMSEFIVIYLNACNLYIFPSMREHRHKNGGSKLTEGRSRGGN